MPKLNVYEDTPETTPTELRLRLTAQSDGGVSLRLVHENGSYITSGFLLTIDKDGAVRRMGAVRPRFGLKLDDCGRVLDLTN